MKFVVEQYSDKKFSLVYDDFSFDVEPLIEGAGSSILINYLQLEIDWEGRLLYPWGYCPLIKYEETNLFPEDFQNYNLLVVLDRPIIPGVSHRLNELTERWPLHINKEKGWVCLGDPTLEDKQLIQFAPDCVAALVGEDLKAVWLHPQKLPPLEKSI